MLETEATTTRTTNPVLSTCFPSKEAPSIYEVLYGPSAPKLPIFLPALRYTFLGVGGVVPLKVPGNALFPGASGYGERFLFYFSDSPLFSNNTKFLLSFSWGVFFAEHNSETGFGQLSEFSRCEFSRF